jgi:hypothetical protein
MAGFRKAFVALALLAHPGPAHAGDPFLAEYTSDPTRIFWFVQITDTHIDNFLYVGEVEQLELALNEAVDVIQPFLVVNTGDLTDHTDGINYLGPPNLAEWILYRSITDDAGMGPDIYFDIPGNHDFYGDDGSFYLAHAVQGVAQGTTQPDMTLDLPFGTYHFVSGATPHNDSPPLPWPFDNKAFTDAELDEVEAHLMAHMDARLTFMFGHHDLEDCSRGGDFRQLMIDYGAAHYAHGHEHDLGMRENLGILRFRCSALGQKATENICIWAVDADTVSWGITDATNPWPAAVITAPADAMLGTDDSIPNPYAPPVPQACTDAPVRVMAWDASGVSEVLMSLDGGGLITLAENPSFPDQWLGWFDATGLEVGLHELEVQVHGDEWRRARVQIDVEDLPCDLEPPPADEEPEPAVEPAPEADDVEPVAEDAEDGYTDVVAETDGDAAEDVQGEGGRARGGCGCTIVD